MAWGSDTCSRADTAYGSSTLAGTVASTYSRSATFWGRYFQPTGAACDLVNLENYFQYEFGNLIDNGINFIVPVCSPGGGRTTGTSAMGAADGNTVCGAIATVVRWSGQVTNQAGRVEIIRVSTNPTTPSCLVYLDIEYNQGLSLDYWNGWANAVFSYSYNDPAYGPNCRPFYPGSYMSPAASPGVCSTICSNANTSGIWAAGAVYNCHMPGPQWAPPDCSCGGPGWPHARVWQYDIDNTCGTAWDFDQSTNGWDETQNIMYIGYA